MCAKNCCQKSFVGQSYRKNKTVQFFDSQCTRENTFKCHIFNKKSTVKFTYSNYTQTHRKNLHQTFYLNNVTTCLTQKISITIAITVLWPFRSETRSAGPSRVFFLHLFQDRTFGDKQQRFLRLTELRFYIPLNTKYVISETLFPANLLASTEKTKIENGKITTKVYKG